MARSTTTVPFDSVDAVVVSVEALVLDLVPHSRDELEGVVIQLLVDGGCLDDSLLSGNQLISGVGGGIFYHRTGNSSLLPSASETLAACNTGVNVAIPAGICH